MILLKNSTNLPLSTKFLNWITVAVALMMMTQAVQASLELAQSDSLPPSRTLTQKMADTAITFRLGNLIEANKALSDKAEVNLTTVNGIVLITGTVKSAADKNWIDDISNKHRNVRKVVNELNVGKYRKALELASDKTLQISVKYRLSINLKKNSPRVHVVVYRKVVYLMGVVTPEIGTLAAETAQNTSNARRVVTIFEYLEGTANVDTASQS